MKRYFCFHCQKQVEPHHIFKWRLCPHCHHRITDDGSGFYRVCDGCGANLASDSAQCLKCGKVFDGQALKEYQLADFFGKRSWFDILFGFGFISAAFLLFIFIFYVSFYIFMAVFLIGGLACLFNMFRRW